MNDSTDSTLRLVSAAYQVAVDPKEFDELLAAWDKWTSAALDNPDTSAGQISPILEKALTMSDDIGPVGPFDPAAKTSDFEQIPAPAVLFDAHHKVIALNSVGRRFLEREGITEATLEAAAKGPSSPPGGETATPQRMSTNGRSYLLFELPVSKDARDEFPGATKLIALSQLDWNDALEQELSERLSISSAELRVARGLLEGRTAQEISDDVGRSLPTIRSHINALIKKTGTRRQSELVQLLTILRHAAGRRRTQTRRGTGADDFETVRLQRQDAELDVVRYGEGHPLLYFTTSTRPAETAPIREAFAAAGFAVTAPYRSGFGGVGKVKRDATDELLSTWLDTLASDIATPLLAGHREGGIVALKAAQTLLSQGKGVAGVVLITTGAPVRRLLDWRHAPPLHCAVICKRAPHASRVVARLRRRRTSVPFRPRGHGQDHSLLPLRQPCGHRADRATLLLRGYPRPHRL